MDMEMERYRNDYRVRVDVQFQRNGKWSKHIKEKKAQVIMRQV